MTVLTNGADAADGVIEFVKGAADALRTGNEYLGGRSLIEAGRHARVEPLMVVDESAQMLQYVDDVAQTMQTLFAGYYLQALTMITNVNGVKLRERLAPLNPNRKIDLDLLSYRLSEESYRFALPKKSNKDRLVHLAIEADDKPMTDEEVAAAIKELRDSSDYIKDLNDKAKDGRLSKSEQKAVDEARKMAKQVERFKDTDEARKKGQRESDEARRKGQKEDAEALKKARQELEAEFAEKANQPPQVSFGKDALKSTQEASSLSVGKMYEVSIKEGNETASVVIAIRLMARYMASSPLIEMFTHKGYFDHDLLERFHGWRSGRLSFVRDLLLCQDLVEAHRNAAIRDKSGIYQEVINRKNSSVAAGLLERNPSLAVMSNLAVITQGTLEAIEAKMGASITSSKIKNTLFDTTNMMILAVMDPDYDRVTFYMHGINGSTSMPMSKLKNSSGKGNGSEVMDVMKAFLSGRSPTL